MAAASVWLALALVAPAPGNDCPECKADDLCGPHQESEKKSLDELRGRLRDKDVAKRTAALREIAALTAMHQNAPARAVVEALAIGLEDRDFDVRALAAELITEGQHPDAAVKVLTRAVDDLRAEFARLGRDNDGGRTGGAIVEEEGQAYAEAVILGLAKLPDDRGVDALVDVLRQLGPDAPNELVSPMARALLELQSRPAVEAVVQRFVAAEGTRSHARGGGAGKGGKAGGGGGGGGGGGPGGGDRSRPRPGDRDGDGVRDRGADEEQRRELHDGLAALARRKNLDDAPPFDERVAQKWKDWFSDHAALFPAKLGRVGSTPLKPVAPAEAGKS